VIRPERRTRADLLAAAGIAAVVALLVAALWWHSSARATVSLPAVSPAPTVETATAVPQALRQKWTTASPKTLAPIVLKGTVITGEGREMTGLDPFTGAQRWLYARDAELCAVSHVYDLAVAVYPDARGCGQVSSVKADTGTRGPARTSYADKQVSVTSNGSTVLSTGPTRLELWRSDLVRMLSYGEIDARVKPVNRGRGAGCALLSAAASDAAAAVLESCPDQDDPRLTVLIPGKEEDEPETKYVPLPGLAVDSEARVLAVVGTTTAVYLPTPTPEVAVYDETATKVSGTVLRVPAEVDGAVPAVTRAGDYVTWWTGAAVMVFDDKLDYRYTLDATGPLRALGPATMMAGRLLVPVEGGLAVFNPANGENERLIAVAHPPGRDAVVPAVAGSLVLEQRGPALTVFGPP